MIGTGLAYVAVVVRDVEVVAATLANDFGLPRTDCHIGDTARSAPVFAIGRGALALFETGDPFINGEERPGVHHIALGAPDPEAAALEAIAAGIELAEGGVSSGLGGSRRVMLSQEATAGVRTYLSEPLVLNDARNGWVERIDHIGVASMDNTVAVDAYSRRLGYPVESTQTDTEVRTVLESFASDKYGVGYHSRPPEIVGGLRVAFVTVGDCELEFLEEYDPGRSDRVDRGSAGSTRQDQGAIGRFIASRGSGLHHVALKVRDIEAAISGLLQAGHEMIDESGRPGSRRAKIGFVHPRSLEGFLMHLVQRDD